MRIGKELKKEIGKFFVDIAKLFIGGIVLSSIIKIQGLSNSVLIIGGAVFAMLLASFGFVLLNVDNKK